VLELESHRSTPDVWETIRQQARARRLIAAAVGGGLLAIGPRHGLAARLAAVVGGVVLARAVAGADDLGWLAGVLRDASLRRDGELDDALEASFPASDAIAP
jgi:hypothetical protein